MSDPSLKSAKAKHGSGTWSDHDDALAELLLRQHSVDPAMLEKVRKEAEAQQLPLWKTLIALNVCLEDELNWAVSRDLNIPFVLLVEEMIDNEVLSRFPLELLIEIQAVPITDAMGDVTLVMADPLDEQAFRKAASHYQGLLHRAVGPSGRVAAILDNIYQSQLPPEEFVSETVAKDTSGVAAVYGMIVTSRKRGANRILIRPAGQSLEAVFRHERGWVVFRTWGRERILAIITRCRIMMGLSPNREGARERVSINARIYGERIQIDAEFVGEKENLSIDFHIFPIISSQALSDFPTLSTSHRTALLNLFGDRRPTGVILVNATDQRQRYRMVYGLLATIRDFHLDSVSVEERKYFELPFVRRFEVAIDTPEWERAIQQKSEALAVIDAPFWRWRELARMAGNRLVLLGVDLANSRLAFRSFYEVIDAAAVTADRLRVIWTGRRVDLKCQACDGFVDPNRGKSFSGVCPECDGYGHSKGSDLFEVVMPDESFRSELSETVNWKKLNAEIQRITIAPTLEDQLNSGLEMNVIFRKPDSNE